MTEFELRQAAVLTSLADPTPEGKSVVALAKEQGERVAEPEQAEFIAFNASTRISGLNLADGHQVRKGAMDAILKFASQNLENHAELKARVEQIASKGNAAGRG